MNSHRRFLSSAVAFALQVSLMLIWGCESPPLSEAESVTAGQKELAQVQQSGGAADLTPMWKLGERVDDEVLAKAAKLPDIAPPELAWTQSAMLRVVEWSALDGGIVRVFFDRPVNTSSVKVDFASPHKLEWLGEQLLVIRPEAKLSEGTHKVQITDAFAMDETSLAKPWSVEFLHELRTSEEGEERAVTTVVSEETEEKRLIFLEPDNERFVRTKRPTFLFYSNEKLAADALEKAVVFAQRKKAFGSRQLIPVAARTRYIGLREVSAKASGRVHVYEATPMHDLEVGLGSYFHVNTRLTAPDYELSEYHWTTHYFGVLERDLTFSFSQHETTMYVTTTHPVSPAKLASCLAISPPPRVYDVSLRDKMRLLRPHYGSWTYLIDVLPAMPGMTYTVKVKASCRSELGTAPRGKLTHVFKLEDDTADYVVEGVLQPDYIPSSLWMPRRSKPMLIESDELATSPYFPVVTRRVKGRQVKLFDLHLAQLAASVYEKRCMSETLADTISLDASDDPLEIKREEIDLKKVVDARYSGMFCIEDASLSGSKRRGSSGATLVATDLAVTRRGSLFWVTRLSSGEPVAGASVKAWNRDRDVISSGETDALGLVEFDKVDPKKLNGVVITAEFDGYATVLEPSSDPASFYHASQWVTHGMTDRGVYRPGDRVHFAGWIRQMAASVEVPDADEVRIRLEDAARGTRHCSSKVSPLGGWSCEIDLASDAPTGTYKVFLDFDVADLHRRSRPVSHELPLSLRVARHEPPRFALDASRAGGKVVAEVFRYAGSPIPGVVANYKLTAQPISWDFKGYEGFVFGEEGEEKLIAEGTRTSNREGRFSIPIPSRGVRIPTRYRAEITAEDIDGEVVTRRLSWVELPERLVGFRVEQGERWFGAGSNGKFRAQVIALSADGTHINSGAVQVSLHKVERHPNDKMGADGHWIRTYATSREEVARCSTRSRTTASGHCDFVVEEGGTYDVELRAGRSLIARESVYISRGSKGLSPNPGEIEVIAKWPHVERGAVAEVLLNSPYTREARALVTAETGSALDGKPRILWRQVIPITSTSTEIEIPIPRDLSPRDVVVTAVVVRGRVPLSKGHPASWSPYGHGSRLFWNAGMHWKGYFTSNAVWAEGVDPGRPLARHASTRFRVVEPASVSASLDLSLASEEVRSGEPVEVALTLKDASGTPQKGEAVVMVVDEGALALSSHAFSLPSFDGSSDHFVATSVFDARDILTTPDELGMKSNPGGGGLSPGGFEDAFRMEGALTVHVERIEVGEDGKGEVRFAAPERLSNYRVMALATHGMTRSTFARAKTKLVVSKTVQVRPSLPRFVSQGDTFIARAMILSEADGPVRVSLNAGGGVELVDPATAEVVVDARKGSPTWARWEVRANGKGLEASFEFQASGEGALEGELDRVRVRLPSRFKTTDPSLELDTWQRALLDNPGWRASRKGLVGPDGVRISLDTSRMKIDSRSLLTLRASASSSYVLEELVNDLVAYPHGCGEQTSSKLHGVLVSRAYAKLHPEWHHGVEELETKAVGGVGRLMRLLRADGSLSLWPSSPPNTWVTLYGTWTLLHARDAGIEVPEQALSRLLRYIEGAQSSEQFKTLQERAFAAWVLAKGGTGSRVKLEILYDARDTMSRVTAAMTAMAFAELGSKERAEAMLELALEDWRTLSRHEAYYSSDRRELAIVLLAVVKVRPREKSAITELFARVLEARGDATQSRAFAALAIFEANQVLQHKDEDVLSVIVAGEVVAQQPIDAKTWSMTIPLETLVAKGTSAIYLRSASGLPRVLYDVEVETALAAGDPTLWNELQVERMLIHASGPKTGQAVRSPLRVGDLVLVHHLIDCRFGYASLAITDPLPAGLERVQTALDTTSSRERELASDPTKVHPALAAWSTTDEVIHQEGLAIGEGLYPRSCSGMSSASYLARAMTPGTFQALAVHAEHMYDRKLQARSSRGKPLVIEE